jgi:hypothetical protein
MSVKKHIKAFGVYYWDTFEEGDDSTFLLHETDTLNEAKEYVQKKYKDRISPSGADQIDIVNKDGDIVEKFSIM